MNEPTHSNNPYSEAIEQMVKWWIDHSKAYWSQECIADPEGVARYLNVNTSTEEAFRNHLTHLLIAFRTGQPIESTHATNPHTPLGQALAHAGIRSQFIPAHYIMTVVNADHQVVGYNHGTRNWFTIG